MDQTSLTEPKGGINKDFSLSNHGLLHREAADLATAASGELLEDIRKAAGGRRFPEYVRATLHIPLFHYSKKCSIYLPNRF